MSQTGHRVYNVEDPARRSRSLWSPIQGRVSAQENLDHLTSQHDAGLADAFRLAIGRQ